VIRNIKVLNLSDMSFEEAEGIMQAMAYETLEGDDVPMYRFLMVKLPDNFNGFFVHLDHRLIDSVGLAVMVKDLMALYAHYKYDRDYPKELADFEKVLLADLEKENNAKRFKRDRDFFEGLLDKYGEPIYSDIRGKEVLETSRKAHKNPKLRSADIELNNLFVEVKDYKLEKEPAKRLMDFCSNNRISFNNLLLLTMRSYLSKVNEGQEDITIENFIARRSTHDEWNSGGSRTIMFPCRTVIGREVSFKEAALEIQNLQNNIYLHSSYDPEFIRQSMKKRFGTPEGTTYESCYLTYQPMPVKMDNPFLKNIPMHAKWFANGAATKKMYLTVSHTEDGGMNFSYHYQTVQLNEKDVELMNYYLMRILFRGIEQPDMTVGEIMEAV
jgi:hypothetical protein